MNEANSQEALQPLVLDTRPFFQRGLTPCRAIDTALEQLQPRQSLVLLVPFEPVPLYTKLANQGFAYQARKLEDGSWRVEFTRGAVEKNDAAKSASCRCEI